MSNVSAGNLEPNKFSICLAGNSCKCSGEKFDFVSSNLPGGSED